MSDGILVTKRDCRTFEADFAASFSFLAFFLATAMRRCADLVGAPLFYNFCQSLARTKAGQ